MKAIITYKYVNFGVCGNTIGANGNGEYGIIITGEDDVVYNKIKEICHGMDGRYTNLVIITDEEQFYGSPIKEYNL